MVKYKSIEPLITTWANNHLSEIFNGQIYPEQIKINDEIEEAFKKSGSKLGSGTARPDNKAMHKINGKNILILFEYKGYIDKHVKLDKQGNVDMKQKTSINNFAVNGAIFYAQAIIQNTRSYDEIIAIGISDGEINKKQLKPRISSYYISRENYAEPLLINDNHQNLEFLSTNNFLGYLERARELTLSPEERESLHNRYETNLTLILKNMNEKLHDLNIDVSSRVNMIAGMIMASMPATENFEPLEYEELKGADYKSERSDGVKILSAIEDFLNTKQIPPIKQKQIMRRLEDVFRTENFSDPNADSQIGESKLKTIYRMVITDLLPFYAKGFKMDFTGKLFDVLNTWVQVPDSGKNDTVLTPRYVTRLMSHLAEVNMDSFVWDFTVGSAGFLVSSMDIMIEDAKRNYRDDVIELNKKISQIKSLQLLGVEKNNDMYMLAVLNMILMGDGSANIIQQNSLTYNGTYQYPSEKLYLKFPANVFLLNPPYSAEGKGLVFVDKALSYMSSGKAVILIQESAGGPQYKNWQKIILDKHSLIASIHMPSDLFGGKAGVQVAILIFEVNKPHDFKQLVKFVDFSYDGYKRTNRKKAKQNLFDVDNAIQRYEELIDLIKYDNVNNLQYFNKTNYVKDTISNEYGDWTYKSHAIIDITPIREDFEKEVKNFLSFTITDVLKNKE